MTAPADGTSIPAASRPNVDLPIPDGPTTTTLPATPVDFGGTPWAPRAMAPDAGAQTDEVLTELGRDTEAIASLRERGIVA